MLTGLLEDSRARGNLHGGMVILKGEKDTGQGEEED